MNLINKLFPPRVITDQMKEEAIKKFTDKLDYDQKNNLAQLKHAREEMRKQESRSVVYLGLAGIFLLVAVCVYLYDVPVPKTKGIYVWYGLTALGFGLLLAQNFLDGPFMKTFRFAKLRGKTVVLVKRGDGRWGWISDDLRGRAVNSDVYGEYAITPGSLAMIDGVPVGFSDESQGMTLPLKLLRLAQEFNVHGIIDYGTLDSIGSIEKKTEEYEAMERNLEDTLKDENETLSADEITNLKQGLTNVKNVLSYLKTVANNFEEIVGLNKYTLALKPLLDFIPTMANNPTFKKTSRERAIAMEKAKSNKGGDPMKWVVMFCMAIGTIAFAIYLVQSGQAQSLISAGGTAAGAAQPAVPQGIN